jgi:hypothetical protein
MREIVMVARRVRMGLQAPNACRRPSGPVRRLRLVPDPVPAARQTRQPLGDPGLHQGQHPGDLGQLGGQLEGAIYREQIQQR